MVLPLLTLCFGPRTEDAGFIGTIWPTTSQSNNSRIAANYCFTEGAANSVFNDSIYAATCTGRVLNYRYGDLP